MCLREKFISYFRKGIKKRSGAKLGVELEHFIVDKKTERLVDFFSENGIEAILIKLSKHYDEKIYSNSHLVALRRKNCLISLEPAGQLEVSLGEFRNIVDFQKEYNRFLLEILPILSSFNQKILTLGYAPADRAKDLTLIPKERYKIMDAHFSRTGSFGVNMMRGSAATHVTIDYFSEEDFSKKFSLANKLVPLFALLTENTKTFEGKKAQSLQRLRIWESVDNARCGIIKGSLNSDFGFNDFANYILKTTPIFTIDSSGSSVSSMGKTVEQLFYCDIATSEMEHILSMFFPFVRLKQYIEIRIADSMPIAAVLGYLALIKGIFYSEKNLQVLLEKFATIDEAQVFLSLEQLKANGMADEVYGENALALIKQIFSLVANSLSSEEVVYLRGFAEFVKNEKGVSVF